MIKTTYILGIITIIDLVWCSQGGVSLFLWTGYGVYKLMKE